VPTAVSGNENRDNNQPCPEERQRRGIQPLSDSEIPLLKQAQVKHCFHYLWQQGQVGRVQRELALPCGWEAVWGVTRTLKRGEKYHLVYV